MAHFFRTYYRALILTGTLALVALSLHFAPAWLRADATPEFPFRGVSRRLFLTGIGLTAVVTVIALLFKRAFFETRRIKTWLIFGVFLSGQLLLFLLPPFQGPDELAHWFTALKFNRRHSAEREAALYDLPYTLHASQVAHGDERFDPRLFRAAPLKLGDGDVVNYANRLSYPFVSAVSLFFPRVQTMQEALVFFYLCRFLPLACLFLLLLYLNRRFELPYLAIWFFSLPLVLQQFTVVSTDTIVNFGVFAVVLLYERLARKSDWIGFVALIAACVLVAGNKPVLWGLFAALLAFIPYRRIPAKFAVLPLAALAAAGIVFIAARHVGGMIVQLKNTKEAASHAAAIVTREGFVEFWNAYVATMTESTLHLHTWAGPLGWLDVELSAHHRSLIRFNFFLCLLLDAARYCFRAGEIRRNVRPALAAAGIAVFVFATLTLSMSAIMYVTWTPEHSPIILGIQMRYWFPAVIFALAISLVLLSRDADGRHAPSAVPSGNGWRALTELALDAVSFAILPLFLFARSVELCVDLMTRYW